MPTHTHTHTCDDDVLFTVYVSCVVALAHYFYSLQSFVARVVKNDNGVMCQWHCVFIELCMIIGEY